MDVRTARQWRWVFLAFVAAVLLASLLSGAFAGSAAASEGNHPAQPAGFLTWHTDNFFTQCDGNCAVSVFGGPQLLTHQYNILVHLTPPWDWRFGNADLLGGAISRRILTLWDSLDIESEFGLAGREGPRGSFLLSVNGTPMAWADPHGASVYWIGAPPGQITSYGS